MDNNRRIYILQTDYRKQQGNILLLIDRLCEKNALSQNTYIYILYMSLETREQMQFVVFLQFFFFVNSMPAHTDFQLYLITGPDCGLDCELDCWTGLMDWITGLNLFVSHDFHPIKCHKFGYFLILSYTSLSHCMLVNVYTSAQCTSYMDRCVPWVHGVHAVSSAPCDYSKYAKEHQKYWPRPLHKKYLLWHGEHWCKMPYWLAVTRL